MAPASIRRKGSPAANKANLMLDEPALRVSIEDFSTPRLACIEKF
jgi:hypothetical protein